MARIAIQLILLALILALPKTSWAGHPDATLLGAAFEGDLSRATASFQHGANPDARYEFSGDQTPLMIAARMGHIEILSLLLSRGADPALTLDAPGRPEHGWTAHDFAREANQIEASQALLRSHERSEAQVSHAGGTLVFGRRMARAALERTRYRVTYDGRYRKIGYPNGDVPADVGVCTDVVIRSYRALGIDLQPAVHEEMTAHFGAFPKIWGLDAPDPNIDHRRVPNLQVFFARSGAELPITSRGSDYLPGDLVTWLVSGKLPHIGIVVALKSNDGKRPLVVHNIGAGPRLEDMLFEYPITGHYRYEGPR